MRKIQVILDDETELKFDEYKLTDHRDTDSAAGRALIIQALAVKAGQKQPTQQAQAEG